MTFIYKMIPYGDWYLWIDTEILIEKAEYNWLVEEIFRYEKIRALYCSLWLLVGIQLKGKVNFVKGVGDDFIFKNAILINNSL